MADARRRAREKRAADTGPLEAPSEAAAPSGSGETPVEPAPPQDAAHADPPQSAASADEVLAAGTRAPEPAATAGAPAAAQEVDEPAVAVPSAESERTSSDASEAGGAPAEQRLVLPSSGLAADVLGQLDEAVDLALEAVPVEASEAGTPQPPATSARAHQFSFFATAERAPREKLEASEHLVSFFVGREEYAVDVHLVQEILRVPAVTVVPRAPEFVRGVINLRGRIIPVVDLAAKLALGCVDERQRRARVVVVRLRGRLIGLLVDGASQVLKVPLSSIDAAPDEVVEVDSGFIRGVAKLERRLLILLDLSEVLAAELRAAGAAP